MALVYCKSQQVAQALQIHFFHTQNESKYSWISSTRGGSVTVYLNTFLLPMQTSWQLWTHTAPALGLNWVVSEHLVFAALLKICPDLLLFKTALVADTLTFAKSFSPEINGLGVSATHLYSVSGEIKVWVHTAQDITFPQPFSSAHKIFVFLIWHIRPLKLAGYSGYGADPLWSLSLPCEDACWDLWALLVWLQPVHPVSICSHRTWGLASFENRNISVLLCVLQPLPLVTWSCQHRLLHVQDRKDTLICIWRKCYINRVTESEDSG